MTSPGPSGHPGTVPPVTDTVNVCCPGCGDRDALPRPAYPARFLHYCALGASWWRPVPLDVLPTPVPSPP